MSAFFNIHKNSFGYITKTLDVQNSYKNPYYSRFTLSVFFITSEQSYIKNLKGRLGYNFFVSIYDQILALKVACIFKISRIQSYLAVAQYFDQINTF